jgi:hypothetical protein
MLKSLLSLSIGATLSAVLGSGPVNAKTAEPAKSAAAPERVVYDAASAL